mgnify:CR=1 FL=1
MKNIILKILKAAIAVLAIAGMIYNIYVTVAYYTDALFTAVPLWMLLAANTAILIFPLAILIVVYHILKK